MVQVELRLDCKRHRACSIPIPNVETSVSHDRFVNNRTSSLVVERLDDFRYADDVIAVSLTKKLQPVSSHQGRHSGSH